MLSRNQNVLLLDNIFGLPRLISHRQPSVRLCVQSPPLGMTVKFTLTASLTVGHSRVFTLPSLPEFRQTESRCLRLVFCRVFIRSNPSAIQSPAVQSQQLESHSYGRKRFDWARPCLCSSQVLSQRSHGIPRYTQWVSGRSPRQLCIPYLEPRQAQTHRLPLRRAQFLRQGNSRNKPRREDKSSHPSHAQSDLLCLTCLCAYSAV